MSIQPEQPKTEDGSAPDQEAPPSTTMTQGGFNPMVNFQSMQSLTNGAVQAIPLGYEHGHAAGLAQVTAKPSSEAQQFLPVDAKESEAFGQGYVNGYIQGYAMGYAQAMNTIIPTVVSLDTFAEQIITVLKQVKAAGSDPVTFINQISDALQQALQPPTQPKMGGTSGGAQEIEPVQDQTITAPNTNNEETAAGASNETAPTAGNEGPSQDAEVGVLVHEPPKALFGFDIHIDWEDVKDRFLEAVRRGDDYGAWPDGTPRRDTNFANDMDLHRG